jgi:hypothetical protein
MIWRHEVMTESTSIPEAAVRVADMPVMFLAFS